MALRTVSAEDEGLLGSEADTEAAIFGDATGTEPLENDGDKSLESMGDGLEGEHTEDADKDAEPEVIEKAPEQSTEGKEQQARDDQGKFIPRDRLNQEAEKRRTAEATAADKDQQLSNLRREFDAFRAGITAPKPQVQEQPQKVEPPDMFSDPEGFRQHVINEARQQATMMRVEGSLSDAADTHGDKFKAAYEELQNIGRSEKQQFGSSPTVNRIWNAANPGKALINWHQQQSTIREVGNDPNAWLEKKLEERLGDPEFLAKAIDRAKGSARQGDNGRPRTATRMPSLNSQTGGSHQVSDPDMDDDSEESVFAFATK